MSKHFTTVQSLCLTAHHAIVRVEMKYGLADSKALALMDVSGQIPIPAALLSGSERPTTVG